MSEPTYGQRLRAARRATFMSQNQFATLAGIDPLYLGYLEDDRAPLPDNAEELLHLASEHGPLPEAEREVLVFFISDDQFNDLVFDDIEVALDHIRQDVKPDGDEPVASDQTYTITTGYLTRAKIDSLPEI